VIKLKKFKTKKKKKRFLFKIILIFLTLFLIYQLFIKISFKINLVSSNEEFILSMLNDNNHHIKYNKKHNIVYETLKYLMNIDISSPKTMLEYVFHYKDNYDEETTPDPVITEYISDPEKTTITDPIIYIYNTHQLESYSLDNYEEYNITPNVQMASYLLKGLLNRNNIGTIVEEANINDFLSLNGWNYSSSYEASRYYIKEALNNYPNLKLLIDLHRDSISKDKSTITIDGKNYAKLLFVIGTDYENYEDNLSLANTLDNLIKEKYSNLSRGVITKGGMGVNGVYNQDLNNKIILIECGGNENTIDEVMNTIIVLEEVIEEYLEG
jgi:stage II sporulation protein P